MSILNDQSLLSLDIITILLCLISSYLYFSRVSHHWAPKYSKTLFCCISSIVSSLFMWSGVFISNEVLFSLLLFCLEFSLIKTSVHITYSQAFFSSITSIIHFMCMKSISIGLLSLLLQKNMYQIISLESTYLLSLVLTISLTIIATYVFKSKQENFHILFNTEKELETVLYMLSSMFAFLLFYSYNYYYNLDLVWFSCAQIILSCIILIAYSQVVSYGLRISKLLEVDLYQKEIHSYFDIQSSQYHIYKKEMQTLDSFKTQYRETMLTLKFLLDNGKAVDALALLKDFNPLIENLPSMYKGSNIDSINALSYAWKNSCETLEIAFDSHISLSQEVELMVNDILKLLINQQLLFELLINNKKNSLIKLVGTSKNNFFVLNSTCTIDGNVFEHNGLPFFATSKGLDAKTYYHRLCAHIYSLNGSISWKFLNTTSLFEITITLQL